MKEKNALFGNEREREREREGERERERKNTKNGKEICS